METENWRDGTKLSSWFAKVNISFNGFRWSCKSCNSVYIYNMKCGRIVQNIANKNKFSSVVWHFIHRWFVDWLKWNEIRFDCILYFRIRWAFAIESRMSAHLFPMIDIQRKSIIVFENQFFWIWNVFMGLRNEFLKENCDFLDKEHLWQKGIQKFKNCSTTFDLDTFSCVRRVWSNKKTARHSNYLDKFGHSTNAYPLNVSLCEGKLLLFNKFISMKQQLWVFIMHSNHTNDFSWSMNWNGKEMWLSATGWWYEAILSFRQTIVMSLKAKLAADQRLT